MNGEQSISVKDKSSQSDLLKIEPFKKHIRVTKPHKHKKYFEIVFLSGGTGKHSIDHQTFDIKPPILFFIRREQVHHWQLESEPEGYVLILKKEFFDQSNDAEVSQLLSQLANLSCIALKEAEALEQLFKMLEGEFSQKSSFQKPIIEGLLKAIFAKVLTYPVNQPKRKTTNDTFQAYLEMLTATEDIKNQVAYYAEKLNTSPQNLSAICRKQTGQSASELLAEHIIKEAKRLLEYSSLSVASIGYQLDFKDPSHFIKFFKKHSQVTPKSYRQQLN